MKASISKYVPLCSPQLTNLNEKAKLTINLGVVKSVNGAVEKAEDYNAKGSQVRNLVGPIFFLDFPLSEK